MRPDAALTRAAYASIGPDRGHGQRGPFLAMVGRHALSGVEHRTERDEARLLPAVEVIDEFGGASRPGRAGCYEMRRSASPGAAASVSFT